MRLGLGLGLTRPMGNGLADQVSALFASGVQGAWYDPSDMSTLFQDSAGTTPVTAVGQPVGRMLDKSGRGNHAIQTTTTARPLLQREVDGRWYLAFDGIDDVLQSAAVDFSAAAAALLTVGARTQSAAGTEFARLVSTGPSIFAAGAFAQLLPFGAANSAGAYFAGAGASDLVASGLTLGQRLVLSSTYAASTGTDALSVAANSAPRLYSGGVLTSGALVASATINLGGLESAFFGALYGVILRAAPSSAAEIAAAQAFMNSKTGAYP